MTMMIIRHGRMCHEYYVSLCCFMMISSLMWNNNVGMTNAFTTKNNNNVIMFTNPTIQNNSQQNHISYKKRSSLVFGMNNSNHPHDDEREDGNNWNRREMLKYSSLWMLSTALTLPANAKETNNDLTGVKDATWSTPFTLTNTNGSAIPSDFVSYLTRIMIRYDATLSSWYSSTDDPEEAFAKLSKSIQLSLLPLFSTTSTVSNNMETLTRQLQSNYPQAKRHLQLLMSMLPSHQQPSNYDSSFLQKQPTQPDDAQEEEEKNASLLPKSYSVKKVPSHNGSFYLEMTPSLSTISASSFSYDRDDWQMTKFGPISKTTPLTRPLEHYSLAIYSLFAISGATGCAMTHSLVIPLDVVKTRMQTSTIVDEETSQSKNNLLESAQLMMKQEGASILLLGSQATLLGYLWYGLTIYPLYTFLKRFFLMNHYMGDANAALLAGALGAVVASVGLTPMEACRIRAVAQPEQYSNGVIDTFQQLNREGENALFAGFTSLTIRQVIFGTVKFLAFERFRDTIFTLEPTLRDSTITVLGVSLLAGACSGALSSIVSQPADSVLTYVAQNPSSTISADGKSSSLLQGCKTMVEENGYSSLLRGLGSRCVWASFIIAGQFLLYDIFRTFFGVNESDLIQTYQIMFSSTT